MDNEVLYPFDVREYLKAIHNAPNGTIIHMADFQPEEFAKCTDCGAEMDWCLTQFHDCQGGKA